MTLLTTFGYPGLQVEIDGEYKSIKPIKNHIVVNLGDTFSRVTNFTLKSTKHRVLDIGVERFSSPFFFEPKYSAVIPANILVEKTGEEPIVYGPWLIKELTSRYAEW
jgi:isopenicillin N synthase-like dioxygenase